jgi:sugar phosphate isomerase/epimerase
MRLLHGLQLGYCTNVHAAGSWLELRRVLDGPILAVKARAAPVAPFGLGLWLSAEAANSLGAPGALAELQEWLRENNCYVFTLNGFPYGKFHGEPVKENVYRPDWTTRERLDHTLRLFDLLAALLPPEGKIGTVSTLPGSFKGFALDDSAEEQMFRHLAECATQLDRLRDRHGRDFVLGLEPEPLGWFETTAETVKFLQKFFARPGTPRSAREVIGVTYDACHLAIEYEDAAASLAMLRDAGIRLAKIHLSSALRLAPTDHALAALRRFDEPVYLHQVIARASDGGLRRWRDLPEALTWAETQPESARGAEWRVHFHVPLHAAPEPPLGDTRGHLLGVLDFLARDPAACSHLEMETYTWAVLPEALRAARVEEQIAAEYAWTLGELRKRKLAEEPKG